MPAYEVFRTSSFRLAMQFAFAFTLLTLLMFAFIYWQTAVLETKRVENELEKDALALSKGRTQDMGAVVALALASQSHRITYVALFTPDGRPLSGNLQSLPSDLPADGRAYRRDISSPGQAGADRDEVLIVRRNLGNGWIFVIGRSLDSLDNLRSIVLRALRLGGLPTVVLALAAGLTLSRRSQERIKAVRSTAERIVKGNFGERLPTNGGGDDFDRLADAVNHMLDDIERLLDEVTTTSNNIAHDLRTPLTRVRSRLERASRQAQSLEELRAMVDNAIVGLDQALRIITALLRIGHLESHRRRANFAHVDLQALVSEIGDLFEPSAEEKAIRLTTRADRPVFVLGDRDLLSEAIANLVDNAIKFTPGGGQISLTLEDAGGVPRVRVADTGPGIAPDERDAVVLRFYRSDRSRHIEGCGLGLSLVEAIAKLHGFHLVFADAGPGCLAELVCDQTPQADQAASR